MLTSKLSQLKNWIRSHQKASLAISGVTIVLLGIFFWQVTTGGTAEVARTEPSQVVAQAEPEPEPDPTVPSPLSGLPVSPELAKRPVTAIVIENSPDARPQSSLQAAGVVFESIAEGGITRYLAFYQENRPDPIGPVRSLRPYFNDWVLAFDASIAHVGGSARALEEARSLGLKDLDQFANGASYYRTTDRFAPHNVYTDFGRLDALNKSLGYTSSEFESWPRKNPKPVNVAKARVINVPISSFTYQSSYTWDRASNTYKRTLAGEPDVDRETGKRLSPAVVVVIESNFTIGADGRYDYTLTGSGKATVFQDGNLQVGTWKKSSRDAQMTFTSDAGNEIAFNPGQVWITAISPSQEVEFGP